MKLIYLNDKNNFNYMNLYIYFGPTIVLLSMKCRLFFHNSVLFSFSAVYYA
uniref:Uncharacterized protein n=1 Tax=Pyropia kanakaensis TaxID=139729 RepID=A0A059XGW2_9RHOD|nr:hypothetical protein [Pyropia kanakaensis]